MKKSSNIKELLANGTVKQKALLIIDNEEAKNTQSGAFLSEWEVRQLMESVKKDERASKEMRKYLDIAYCYQLNRFRFYGLQENLKKLSARILGYLHIWELSERYVEYNNTLLGLITATENKGAKVQHQADVLRFIYQNAKGWNRYVRITKKEGSEELELDLSTLREIIDGVVADYENSLSIAKAFVIASDEFIERYSASAFVPKDVKDMFEYFKSPNTDIPEIYRRDSYLELVKAKGENDREVRYRAKYAILPAWEELEPAGLENARESLSL